ncbi:MAG: ATP-binding cassette domain-containing protein [Bacteroidota bacterium]
MNVIEVENLHFGYRAKTAILESLNLSVPEGSIYGFLGANGAGKSTTIRNILGLLKPRSGSICLFGKELKSSVPSVFAEIGALIESPSLYHHLSGVENLKIACKYQRASYTNIENTLARVGLAAEKNKKVKHYSMGMKQRLGLALALIHDPQLLILDEPINGLDPSGINEIRDTLLRLRDEGKTILLSSHILAEVEKIASRIGIIKDGAMVFEGSLQELEEFKSLGTKLRIQVGHLAKAKNCLENDFHVEADPEAMLLEIDIDSIEHIPEIVQRLVGCEVKVYEVQPVKKDLEQMFLSIANN